MSARPDTIVLIHGFWVTPRSWEQWMERYEAAGFKVITPAYPGFEVEVEALNGLQQAHGWVDIGRTFVPARR